MQGPSAGLATVVGPPPGLRVQGHGFLGVEGRAGDPTHSRVLRSFVLAAVGILLLYGVAGSLGTSEGRAMANATLPAAMGLLCLGCAAALVRTSSLMVLMPTPWFLVTSAAYFGLGPLLFVFGPPGTIEDANIFWPVTEESLFRTNVLNAACIVTVVTVYWVSGRSGLLRSVGRLLRMAALPEQQWLKVFLVVGVAVKYLLYLPYAFGVLTFIPASSFMVFGGLSSVALLMLSRRVFSGQWRFLPLFMVVAGLELAGGLLTFSKLEALLVVIFIGVGAYLARPTRTLAVGFCLVAGSAYLVLIPLVNYGRRSVGPSAGASDRGQAFVNYTFGGPAVVPAQDEDIAGWWSRLSYPPVQTFVMDAYDSGAGGTSLQKIPMSLIPRFLWPSKPIVTIGDELTILINRNAGSMSSPTSFGEGYWNGGWLGALGVAVWMGLVFRFFQTICLGQLARGNFGVLPFAAMGTLMGLRADDWFGPTYVGGFAIALAVYASCLTFARALHGNR